MATRKASRHLPAGREAPGRRWGAHPRRNLHAGAWWAWAVGTATAAMQTTNPLLLGLLLASVGYVVAARRSDSPWARSFTAFLRLGCFVVVLRVVMQVLFGVRHPGTVLFTLPEVQLPGWAAGVGLGGDVTIESLAVAACEGMRLAVVLACFGAVNTLTSPYRMLKSLPAVLYEAGVAVTVALSFAPEAVAAVGRLSDARRLRGRPTRGLRAIRGTLVPILEDALDRSVQLAASMDSRGYGRRGDMTGARRRVLGAATAGGLLAVSVGVYAVLDAGAPQGLGLPLLAGGSVVLSAGLLAAGRRSPRTRYRPDPWRGSEWVVALGGLVAAGSFILLAHTDPAGMRFVTGQLTWPALPPLALVATAAVLGAAVAAPLPPAPAGDLHRRSAGSVPVEAGAPA